MTETPAPVEVFGVGPDGRLIPLNSPSSSAPQEQGDADRLWGGGLHAGPSSTGLSSTGLSSTGSRRAARPGGYADRPTRRGGREDVIAPVPVLPGLASRTLHDGGVFVEPLPGLTVDVDSLEVDSQGSSWDVTVRCKRFGPRRRRSRRATLRAYPSPSANLTVLELVPTRRRLVQTRAFVEAGVPAIATLSGRIASVAATSTSARDEQ